jgi:hypothetical protein
MTIAAMNDLEFATAFSGKTFNKRRCRKHPGGVKTATLGRFCKCCCGPKIELLKKLLACGCLRLVHGKRGRRVS